MRSFLKKYLWTAAGMAGHDRCNWDAQLYVEADAYDRLFLGLSKTEDEIQQALGKALHYPWFKDDQKCFPGTDESDGVCVGDHVAVTLAMEAADRIRALENEVAVLTEKVKQK